MKITIVLVILIAVLVIPMWCCLVAASDYDDAMNYEERENDESSKH